MNSDEQIGLELHRIADALELMAMLAFRRARTDDDELSVDDLSDWWDVLVKKEWFLNHARADDIEDDT